MSIELPSQSEMLKDVMRHAFGVNGTYVGEGEHWGFRQAQREEGIASRAYVRVLRSEGFCRAFWTFRLTAMTLPQDASLSDAVFQRIPEDFDTRWQKHHKELQTEEDPIRYCWLSLYSGSV